MIGHGTAMADDDWTVYGHDLENTHFAMGENDISPDNVHQLQVKWAYQTTPDVPVDPLFPLAVGDVTVPPAVVDGTLYYYIVRAVDTANGEEDQNSVEVTGEPDGSATSRLTRWSSEMAATPIEPALTICSPASRADRTIPASRRGCLHAIENRMPVSAS